MNCKRSTLLLLLVFCVAWQRTDAWLDWLWQKDASSTSTSLRPTTTKIVNCPEYVCQDTGKCVTYTRVCDGYRDCNNGEDEESCLHDCAADSFVCNTPYLDNHTCIPPSLVCNNASDCPDGEDESPSSCSAKACPLDSFKCADGVSCISSNKVCDTVSNCADGSDERNCTTFLFFTDGWPCYNKLPCLEYFAGLPHCYDASEACDGVKQCANGQDELQCSNVSSVASTHTLVTAATIAPENDSTEEQTLDGNSDAESPVAEFPDDSEAAYDIPEPEFPELPVLDKPEVVQPAENAAAAADDEPNFVQDDSTAAAAADFLAASSASQSSTASYDAASTVNPWSAEGQQPALWHIVTISVSAVLLLAIIIIAVVCVMLRYKLKKRNATAIAISGKQTLVTKDDVVHAEAALVQLINRDVQITLPTDSAPLCRGQTVSTKY